jgi:hypothetical protein
MLNIIPKTMLGGFFSVLFVFIVINFFVRIFTKKNTRKRPTEITTVCIMEVGSFVLAFQSATFSLYFQHTNQILLLLNSLNLLWVIGLWQMKRWGFIGFLASYAAIVFVNLILNNWSGLAVSIILIILLAPVLIYFPESK